MVIVSLKKLIAWWWSHTPFRSAVKQFKQHQNIFFVCLNDKKPENNFVEDKEDEEKKSDLVSPRRFELSVAKRWREGERERKTVMEGMRMLSYNYARIHAYRQKAPASGEWRYIDDIIIALHLILYFFHNMNIIHSLAMQQTSSPFATFLLACEWRNYRL